MNAPKPLGRAIGRRPEASRELARRGVCRQSADFGREKGLKNGFLYEMGGVERGAAAAAGKCSHPRDARRNPQPR